MAWLKQDRQSSPSGHSKRNRDLSELIHSYINTLVTVTRNMRIAIIARGHVIPTVFGRWAAGAPSSSLANRLRTTAASRSVLDAAGVDTAVGCVVDVEGVAVRTVEATTAAALGSGVLATLTATGVAGATVGAEPCFLACTSSRSR